MEDEGKADQIAGVQKPKPMSFQVQALLLIAENPQWTAAEIAQSARLLAVELYRDGVVRLALQMRTGDGPASATRLQDCVWGP